jgi:hypothetical protein
MFSRRFKILSIVLLVVIICLLFIYQYLINIYEVIVISEPKYLYADNQSQVTIMTVPINSTGKKAWFRSSPAEFIIKEGADLAETIINDKDEGILILKAKSETGTIVIEVKTKYSLLPIVIEIPVYPNYT